MCVERIVKRVLRLSLEEAMVASAETSLTSEELENLNEIIGSRQQTALGKEAVE